jgi:hypothetical protein
MIFNLEALIERLENSFDIKPAPESDSTYNAARDIAYIHCI